MTARTAKTNALGLEKTAYKGAESTLCNGCGHDSISAKIIDACWELGLDQRYIFKLSGIGCSSKTPAYFLGLSHSFNTVHGRMPSVATGATLANNSLICIGVSGDGDTGSIGLGQFKHLLRRNVPMVYIVENNGVYGLTKGQFSATADENQRQKYYGVNPFPPIDLCLEAIVADCTFVARSFSGDPQQCRELIKAALSHKGTALLDIISPCVTFNDTPESTKSYAYGKANNIELQQIEHIPPGLVIQRQEITIPEYAEGETITVTLHDGSQILLKKTDHTHDPRDKQAAIRLLEQAKAEQKFITGLIYIAEPRPTLGELERLTDTPLATLPQERLRPSREALAKVMASLS
ncbi:MAG: 2-oxoglutarate ferredoxin oxidoreductase subunit beta [Candidatus Thermofonsia Clade 1 bacterium]|uniref:2-oxoglutarate ferredoxin oxidoreductase subunit beta n=1 Tax=Candidatus Thermofonsia Clade 1 bacterium TaxID=2364210 RepID=A0A2M8P1Z5_9CHLR|nr:MAG: 2-oxoglutarate ferredoxin oxidoreductase subunit beta [Candidatus Thermofonsia Clade 1 bacterium]